MPCIESSLGDHHGRMRSLQMSALFALIIISGGLALSQRLVEQRLNVDGMGASNAGPIRTTGYFKVNKGRMFFWFFEAQKPKPEEQPLVVWMTGGPGCSSELAVFYENGPFRIRENLTLSDNKYGWDQTANVIFVDQPLSVGFSVLDDKSGTVYDEGGVATDMLLFLNAFREAHPTYFEAPLFITGESYGGHYVPAVTSAIYNYNKVDADPFKLQGMAIGNGLTNPAIQYGSYADFSFANGLISKGLQSTINTIYPLCAWGVNVCNAVKFDIVCELALLFCQNTVVGPIQAAGGNFNVYDIRKPCIGQLCYDFSRLDDYLAQPKVREALGVDERAGTWQSCNQDVYNDFLGDIMRSYSDKVSELLDAGIEVLIYVGVEDWICNWCGNQAWLDVLAWSRKNAWYKAAEQDWTLDGQIVGRRKSVGPLLFVKIFGAGHMVPMDKPKVSLELISNFTQSGRGSGTMLKSGKADKKGDRYLLLPS